MLRGEVRGFASVALLPHTTQLRLPQSPTSIFRCSSSSSAHVDPACVDTQSSSTSRPEADFCLSFGVDNNPSRPEADFGCTSGVNNISWAESCQDALKTLTQSTGAGSCQDWLGNGSHRSCNGNDANNSRTSFGTLLVAMGVADVNESGSGSSSSSRT